MNKKNICIILICIILILSLIGCDHTQLTGEIIVADTKVKVGQTIALKLEVPESLSGIYRVMWGVDPKELGEIMQGDEVLESLTDEELESYFGQSEGLNEDRIALFTAKKKGKCEVFVEGFYKQTNPQGITSIKLEIE